MESWLKDTIGDGAGWNLVVRSSRHHTWVMFVEPWPDTRALIQRLLHRHWLPIVRAKYSMVWNLGSRIWFEVGAEGIWLFRVLSTTHGSCSLKPGQLSEPWAKFCCVGIGCPFQGLSIHRCNLGSRIAHYYARPCPANDSYEQIWTQMLSSRGLGRPGYNQRSPLHVWDMWTEWNGIRSFRTFL